MTMPPPARNAVIACCCRQSTRRDRAGQQPVARQLALFQLLVVDRTDRHPLFSEHLISADEGPQHLHPGGEVVVALLFRARSPK